MSQRVALITGGARGIGKQIALALARKDWNVAICYRTSEDDANETVSLINEIGPIGYAEECDVSDPKAAQNLVKNVEKKFGRIDALINCAGPYHRTNILKETTEGWNSMFDNNLHPVFYLNQAVSEGMIDREWGRVINFSMANADKMMAQTEVTAHYIAKAGVLMLTRAFAKQLAPHGITVNTISPGFVNSGSAPEDELQVMVKRIPAGYIGSTKDAVDAALYLVSEEAAYVNGSNMILSGGWGL
ncbi:MAG: beta-ketoacyl-ACP reductase [Thermodesulfobacteriota bacterium]|nr:MAG: beta-ketoacyl-ACP reductase [Thermodesulfobacteriota bacterium]